MELLPDGLVLVSTVSNAHALDRATGAQRWKAAGSYVYAPAALTESGLVLIDEWGRLQASPPGPAWPCHGVFPRFGRGREDARLLTFIDGC